MPFGTVNVTGGAGVGARVVFVADAGVVRAGVVGVAVVGCGVGVAALLGAVELPFPAAVVVVVGPVTSLGIVLNGFEGLKSENRFSWPGPRVATATPVGDVVVDEPAAPGVGSVVVEAAGAEELEPPLNILRTFGPWMTAMPTRTTPRTIAMMRARRWRSWAWVGRREAAISESS
jgi:hypothetical protein